MAVLTDVRIFCGGADLTGQSNTVELSAEHEEKKKTTFASGGWGEVAAGITSAKVGAGGLWAAGDLGQVDDAMWAEVGGSSAWTLCPESADVGGLGYLLKPTQSKYMPMGGSVGDLAPWTAEAASTWPLVRGLSAHPPGTARTADGSGTAVQIAGGVASGSYLYATLHVIGVSGTATPTLTVTVESDVDASFLTPATQISFAAATALGGQVLRAAGPITDTWYRVSWTITGTSPSFLFLAAVGVF